MFSKLDFLPFFVTVSCLFSVIVAGKSSSISHGSSIPAVPTDIVPSRTYDVNLPPFPTTYSDAEKSAQASAGNDMVKKLDAFFQAHLNGSGSHQATYTVPPGVYRLAKKIDIPNVVNVKLIMANVELISTTTDLIWQIGNADNLEIAGPVHIDADPIPDSQGTIVGTDYKTYVDVKTMHGYREPNFGSRIIGYTPDGTPQRHYQDAITKIEAQGNDVFRIYTAFLHGDTPTTQALIEKAFKPGNFFSSQYNTTTASGGMNLQGVGDLYMHDIYMYASALNFCQNIQGTLRLDKYMGQRRPGTNRLGAGGWLQCGFDGGSLDMTSSEISHNYDDLTDITGAYTTAMAGPSPNQLYLTTTHGTIGREFTFYDATDLTEIGTAKITRIDNADNPSGDIMDKYSALAKTAETLWNADDKHILVTMSAPITGHSNLYGADDLASRPKLLSIRNTYLHDSLAAGIQLRGADFIVATGNVIERAAINCMQAGFSNFWTEGGPPKEILFANNYCIDSPYSVNMATPSIIVYTENYAWSHAVNKDVFKNVTIRDNVVVRPQLGAITVGITTDVDVTGNAVYDPAGSEYTAVQDEAKPPYIISLQTVGNANAEGNQVFTSSSSRGGGGENGTSVGGTRQLQGHFIVVNNRTNGKNVQVRGNSFDGSGNDKVVTLDTTLY